MAMDITTLSVNVKSTGIDSTSQALENLAKSAEKAEKAVDKMEGKFKNSRAGIDVVKESINSLKDILNKSFPTDGANSLTKAMKELSDAMSKIKGKNINVNFKEIGDSSHQAVKGVTSLNQSLMQGHNIFQVVGKSLYSLRNLLGGTMLAGALIEAAKSTVTLADSWTLAKARLELFLGGVEAASAAQQNLFNISQELKVPMKDMTTLFTRLVPAMQEYGYSTKDAMNVTTAMGAALKVSGATVAETSSVLLQFSQSMAAGRLNGAEFNAVAEGAPIILRLLSKELGVSRGELKKMAADGLLSTSLLTRVLNNNMKELTEQAKKMPLTVGSAFGALSDSFMKFVGEMNEGTGITGAIAAGIKLLADNLSNLFAIIEAGAVGFVAFKAGLLGYNILIASSTALSASLAAELGILSVASTTAAGGFALLSRAALAFITNPVVLGIAAIAAGAYYLTKALLSTETAAEKTSKAITEDLAKGDAASAFNKQQTQAANLANQYNLLAGEINRVKREMDAAKSLGASTKSQQEQLDGLNKKLKEVGDQLNKNVSSMKEFNREMGDKKIKESADAMEEYMEKMRSEISLGHRMTKAEEERFRLQKIIAGFTSETTEQTKLEYANKLRNAEAAIIVEKQHKAALDANKSATKEVESAAKKAENAYLKALQSSVDFIEKQKEELSLQRELTEGEKVALKLRQDAYDFANKTGKSNKELLSNIDKIEELEFERKLRESINKLQSDRIEKEQRLVELQIENNKSAFENGIAGKEKLLAVQDKINGTYTSEMGLQNTVVQNEEDRISFLNAQIDLYKKRMDIMLLTAQAEVLVNPDDKAAQERLEKLLDLRDKMLDGLNKEISASQSKLKIEKDIQAEMSKGYQKRLDSIGRTPGAILAEGFGEAGKAISNMTKAYDVFGEQSSRINAELAAQQEALKAKGFGDDSKEMIAAREAAADKQVQINAQMFASMAGAAKGFFSENSKGYQLMAKAEKAFRVLELAMATKNFLMKTAMVTQEVIAVVTGEGAKTAAEETGTVASIASSIARGTAKAAEAVASAFAAPFPLNFAAGAAMIAVMAGLGYMVGGGGGSSGPSSADRQSSQGTGTVFGDTSAKSESITNALETLSENSDISLKYNEGMLNALKNIEASLAGVGKLVVRSGIQTDLGNSDGLGKTFSSSLNKVFSAGDTVGLGMVTGGLSIILSPIKAIGNALFNTKKSLVDSGFIQNAQAFGDILNEGLDIMGYRDIETKKKKFGKTKTSTETDLVDLSDELQTQLTLAVTNIGDSVKQAAVALGMNSESFNNTLNSFVVDLGRISIQGMSSEDLQKTLTNVFSKLGDEMALAVMPGVMEFQELGEGMLETLIRVASTVATVDGIFDSIGQTFSVTGEAGLQAKMELVDLAGGLENLASLVGSFYENFYTESEKTANTTRLVSEEFSRLGIEMLDLNAKDARIKFRDLVNSYKDTNSEVYLSLLGLQDKISDLVPAFDEASSSADTYSKKLSLEARLRELTMSDIDLLNYNREQELLSMDASLVALQKRIWALEDERVALDKLKNAAQGALSGLEKSVGAEKTKLKKDLDDKLKVIDKLKTEENARYEAERQNIQDQARLAEDAFNATKQAQQNSVQTSLSNAQDISNSLKELFDSIAGGVDALRASTSAYTSQSYASAQAQLDSALMLAKSTGVLPDATRFKDVISSLTSVDKSSFASAFDYERNQLVTAGKLEQIQGVAGTKLSAADQTVKLLESQLRSIDSMSFSMSSHYDTLLTQAEEQHKLNIEKLEESEKLLREQYELDVFYLDGILENAKTQLEIANGSFVALTDIDTALETYNSNLTAYIEKQAGKDEILAQIGAMTNKVTSIEIPSMQVKDEELATQIKQLSDDMKAANRSIAENTLKTAKILDRWDGDGQPEQRVI